MITDFPELVCLKSKSPMNLVILYILSTEKPGTERGRNTCKAGMVPAVPETNETAVAVPIKACAAVSLVE